MLERVSCNLPVYLKKIVKQIGLPVYQNKLLYWKSRVYTGMQCCKMVGTLMLFSGSNVCAVLEPVERQGWCHGGD